eukprot:6173259-Pleurochrysis_carterae.AAC.1
MPVCVLASFPSALLPAERQWEMPVCVLASFPSALLPAERQFDTCIASVVPFMLSGGLIV